MVSVRSPASWRAEGNCAANSSSVIVVSVYHPEKTHELGTRIEPGGGLGRWPSFHDAQKRQAIPARTGKRTPK